MKVQISFKNLKHTDAIDQKIREKSLKLEKYLGDQTSLNWTCYIKEGKHYSDLKLIGPRFEFNAKASSDNMYKTLDLAISKIEKQIHKKKDLWKNKINKQFQAVHPNDILEPEVAWTDYDEDKFDDVG
jgi:putative sigma-54 modulation protein